MNSSASRFENHFVASVAADDGRSTLLLGDRTMDPVTIDSVMRVPVAAQPLLVLQRLALQEIPVIIVCDDFRAAQRYYCEAVKSGAVERLQPFIIHEMMPAHHQEFVFDSLGESRDFALPCNVALFTTQKFMHSLVTRLDWLVEIAEIIVATDDSHALRNSDGTGNGTATVSCICLRSGAAGRWVLMDHDEATTVQPDIAPAQTLVERLLRHTVDISGDRLAPYLAMMFDVPNAWKAYPELATKSLLIFNADACNLGCLQPGIPQRIVWNDLLGIVYER